MSDRDTLKVYDARAAEYARLTGEGQASDPHLAAFIEECEAGGRVLDLGCGPGVAAGVLAQAGFEVDATDAWPRAAPASPHGRRVSTRSRAARSTMGSGPISACSTRPAPTCPATSPHCTRR